MFTCGVVLRPQFCGSPIQDKEQRQSTDISCILYLQRKRLQFTSRLQTNNQRKLSIFVYLEGLCLGRRHWFMAQKVFLDDEREQVATLVVGLTNPTQLSWRRKNMPAPFGVCLRVRGERDQGVSCEQGWC